MRWAGHVACTEQSGIKTGFWWDSEKEREDFEDLNVDGRMLK
jgi:hypothetical protein